MHQCKTLAPHKWLAYRWVNHLGQPLLEGMQHLLQGKCGGAVFLGTPKSTMAEPQSTHSSVCWESCLESDFFFCRKTPYIKSRFAPAAYLNCQKSKLL